jgi:hypothetical protein
MPLYAPPSSGSTDTRQIMAAVSDTSAKAAQALTILQAIAPKLDDIYNGQVSLRQQVADLLVGAGVPDSLAAQVDALLVQAQLNESKVNAAIALARNRCRRRARHRLQCQRSRWR